MACAKFVWEHSQITYAHLREEADQKPYVNFFRSIVVYTLPIWGPAVTANKFIPVSYWFPSRRCDQNAQRYDQKTRRWFHSDQDHGYQALID